MMMHPRSTLLAATALALLAGPAMADTATSAGVTAAVNPQATGTEPAGPTRILEVGTNIVMNEKVETGPGGQTQLLFRDGSTMTVGPSAQLMIDKFVYDPDTRTAQLAMTLASGVVRFVGGRASKGDDGVTIKTPVAVMGIRGGIADIEHNAATGTTTGQFLFGRQMSFSTGSANQTLTTPGFAISIGQDGRLSQPFMITPQSLAQTNRSIEGKAGGSATAGGNGTSPGNGGPGSSGPANANAAGPGSASASLDDGARIVSAANSSAPPAPPQPPPIIQVAAQQAQTETQTVITTITNQQGSGVLNNASGGVATLGTTAAPQLTSGTYNGAGILPESDTNTPRPGNAATYPTYSFTQQNPGGNGSITVTDTRRLTLQFSNNQIQAASTSETYAQSGATITQGGNYSDNSTGHLTFSGTNLGNIIVDNNIFLGVITGGTITNQNTDSFTGGPQSNSQSRSYTLLPTDNLPVLFGRPIDPSLMPSSALYTYNLTASTPVYLSNGQSSPGQLTASVLTVYFGGSASSAQDNVAAAWTGQISLGGHAYQISTAAAGTAASLSQALSSSGKNAALTGSTARGDLSGVFNLVSTNGGTFCAKACQGAAAGFFAGSTGKQIGLAYQAPGNTSQTGLPAGTPNLVGAASFTRQ